MPSIEENKQSWDSFYGWPQGGEEWSSSWGGSEAQWFGAIFPRIHAFVPTGTILEIAPGYGRWTYYLRERCEQLIAVDLSPKCIEACRQKFAAYQHITCYVNDGKSLSMIANESIDFVFSFDSLVHAEADVIETYLNQLARKLKANGIGFIHHSNIGEYQQPPQMPEDNRLRLNNKLARMILSLAARSPAPTIAANPHWRAASMTAKLFEEYCEGARLQCISQELVNWGTDGVLNDCFSVFTPQHSIWSRSNRRIRNTEFMKEAASIKQLSDLYTSRSFLSADRQRIA